jgi:hypothetical protein
MPAKKMRVEVFDGTGNKYTVTFDGDVTRDKALRLLDIVELLGGMPSVSPSQGQAVSELPKLEKLRLIVEKHFPIIWFSSKDVQGMYEQEFKEPIALSMVCTYLARMAKRGMLMKTGLSNSRRYRLTTQTAQSALRLAKDNK